MRLILIISVFCLGSISFSQTIHSVDNLNDFIVCDITGVKEHAITYTYDTSMMWIKELGFDIGEIERPPPDTMNIQINGICFLSVYQVGIEYLFIEALKEHPLWQNLSMIELVNNTDYKGWLLVRRSPALFVSVDLIRKLLGMYYL